MVTLLGGAGSKISRTTTLEFQDFSGDFHDLCPFPGLSRPKNLNILNFRTFKDFPGSLQMLGARKGIQPGKTCYSNSQSFSLVSQPNHNQQ